METIFDLLKKEKNVNDVFKMTEPEAKEPVCELCGLDGNHCECEIIL